MSTGYTKLFADIITSTIWQEPNDCRVLWITILALKDEANICRATVPALAKMCDLTNEKCDEYLLKFQQPDKYSRSQDFDGRRIEPIDGGYLVLNGQKYRDMLRGQERRDYVRDRVAEHRERVRIGKQCKQNVNKSKHGNQCKPIVEEEVKEQAKAEVKADNKIFTESPQTTDGRHREIMQSWSERYKAKTGRAYLCDGGRDGKALQKFLKVFKDDAETFLTVAEQAWTRNALDAFSTASKKSFTIHELCQFWNQINAELKRPMANGSTTTEPAPKDYSSWHLKS